MNRYEPKWARCYCAVTVTAAAAVASAGVAAYGAYSQSEAQKDAASAAQSAAGADPSKTYGKPVKLPDYQDNVVADPKTGTLGRDIWEDFNDSLPAIFEVSNSVNARNIRMRDRLSGGTWKNNLQQQGQNIASMLEGEIPADVQDQINRYVAERTGGAFDPSVPGGYAGGMSQMGTSLARSLGLTSLDIMDKGMSYAPQWEQMIDAFTYKPTDAIRDAGTFLSAAQLQLQRDNAQYESGVNKALAESRPDPRVAGAINDNLRLDTVQSQADANRMKAMSGLITAGAGGATNLYNSFAQPNVTNAAVPNVVSTPSGAPYAYKGTTGFYKV